MKSISRTHPTRLWRYSLVTGTSSDAADIVIANLNPFRGDIEPDSGTVWEVGYAIGRGKPVIGYLASAETMQQRILSVEGRPGETSAVTDRNGKTIEPFGYALNLMLVHSADLVVGDFEDACRRARACVDQRSKV